MSNLILKFSLDNGLKFSTLIPNINGSLHETLLAIFGKQVGERVYSDLSEGTYHWLCDDTSHAKVILKKLKTHAEIRSVIANVERTVLANVGIHDPIESLTFSREPLHLIIEHGDCTAGNYHITRNYTIPVDILHRSHYGV